jgi:hypothetical protein
MKLKRNAKEVYVDCKLIRKDSKGTVRVWEIWIEDGPPVRLVKSYGV